MVTAHQDGDGAPALRVKLPRDGARRGRSHREQLGDGHARAAAQARGMLDDRASAVAVVLGQPFLDPERQRARVVAEEVVHELVPRRQRVAAARAAVDEDRAALRAAHGDAGRFDAPAAHDVKVRLRVARVAEEEDARPLSGDAEPGTALDEQPGQALEVEGDDTREPRAGAAEDRKVRRLDAHPFAALRGERDGSGRHRRKGRDEDEGQRESRALHARRGRSGQGAGRRRKRGRRAAGDLLRPAPCDLRPYMVNCPASMICFTRAMNWSAMAPSIRRWSKPREK